MDLYRKLMRKIFAEHTRKFKEVKANRTGLNMEDWDKIWEVETEVYADLLKKGHKLYLPFGTFELRPLNNVENNPILRINPDTDFRKYRVSFKASERFKNMINDIEENDNTEEIGE